jgi:DNA-binding transcriptional LysR family regulator
VRRGPENTPVLLRQLRYFVAAAEAGQITEAANRLGIAQPTLSHALAQLEAQVGVRLLQRGPQGVELTHAGRVFLEKARAAVEAAAEASETAKAFSRSVSQELAVGVHWAPLTRWGPMFQRLLAEQPSARILWRRLGFPSAGRLPLEDADVGVLYEPPPHPELSTLTLEREPRVVVLAVTHPLAARRELSVADVLDEPFPGPDRSVDPAWRAFWTLDEQRGGPAKVTDHRITEGESGVEIVAAGDAVATVTASAAAALTHPGLMAIPLGDAPPASLALVWRTEHDNPLVDALVAIATDLVGKDGALVPT